MITISLLELSTLAATTPGPIMTRQCGYARISGFLSPYSFPIRKVCIFNFYLNVQLLLDLYLSVEFIHRDFLFSNKLRDRTDKNSFKVVK